MSADFGASNRLLGGGKGGAVQIIAPSLFKKALCEAIGTFFLLAAVGFSTRSFKPPYTSPTDPAMVAANNMIGHSDGPALAIGATLMVMVYAGGHVSGGHYNPAVTLALWISNGGGKSRCAIPTGDACVYVISQLLGGYLGMLVVSIMCEHTLRIGPVGAYSAGAALFAEFVFTFALAYTVLGTATVAKVSENSYYGMAIGFTVVAGALCIGPISGCAMNPAVATALAATELVGGTSLGFAWLWIYWLGPLSGGALAGVAFRFLHPEEYAVDKSGEGEWCP